MEILENNNYLTKNMMAFTTLSSSRIAEIILTVTSQEQYLELDRSISLL